jgi:hypothetical protein
MVSGIKKFFRGFRDRRENKQHSRMTEFLSQAYDRGHLEYLMKQWDEKQRQERCDARKYL